jgi:hypothetical protein
MHLGRWWERFAGSIPAASVLLATERRIESLNRAVLGLTIKRECAFCHCRRPARTQSGLGRARRGRRALHELRAFQRLAERCLGLNRPSGGSTCLELVAGYLDEVAIEPLAVEATALEAG